MQNNDIGLLTLFVMKCSGEYTKPISSTIYIYIKTQICFTWQCNTYQILSKAAEFCGIYVKNILAHFFSESQCNGAHCTLE